MSAFIRDGLWLNYLNGVPVGKIADAATAAALIKPLEIAPIPVDVSQSSGTSSISALSVRAFQVGDDIVDVKDARFTFVPSGAGCTIVFVAPNGVLQDAGPSESALTATLLANEPSITVIGASFPFFVTRGIDLANNSYIWSILTDLTPGTTYRVYLRGSILK